MALGKIGNPQAVAGLIAALNDSESDVRRQAAEALGKIEDLSNALAQWFKQGGHSSQLEAWRQVLSGLLRATVEKLLGTNPDTVPTSEFPLNKSTLQNAISVNSI